MAHNHSHNCHHHDVKNEKISNITIAFLLNFTFAIIEFFGGIYTGSTAILSDAIHDLNDSITLLLSMIFERVSRKPSNETFTFGYKRITIVGSIINLIILFVGTLFVFFRAINALYTQPEIKATGMLFLSILGIAVNGISVLRMGNSNRVLDKTVKLHLLEDLLGWISVLIVSIAIIFTNLYILDTLLSFALCGFVFYNVFLRTIEVCKIIMECNMDKDLYNDIKENILALDEVEEITDFKMWTLDGEEYVVTLKVKSDNNPIQNIKNLLEDASISNSTIELV